MSASSFVQPHQGVSTETLSVRLLVGQNEAYSRITNDAEPYEKPKLSITSSKRKIPTEPVEEDLIRSLTSADESIQGRNEANRTNVVSFNRQSRIARDALREEILQNWEGRIVRITNNKITANLIDIENEEKRESSSVSIPKREFSDDDLATLKVGSVFIWLIGYRYKSNGSKERFSRIILRRLPVWTKREIERADCRARKVAAALEWD